MPWQGEWNGGVWTGSYTTDNGTVFNGTWTPPAVQDPPGDPPLSNYNPFLIGAPLNNNEVHQGPWQGSYDASGVWTGTYTAPDGTTFEGTMTPPQH
jgi:hypothetical protein